MKKCDMCDGKDTAFLTWEHINKFGLSVVGTAVDIKGISVPMTYSVGITYSIGEPEIIIFGLDSKIAQVFINMYYVKLKNKIPLELDVPRNDFAENNNAIFCSVSYDQAKKHMFQAVDFNRDNNIEMRAVQMIYPDQNNNWPWDADTNEDFRTLSNVLKDLPI